MSHRKVYSQGSIPFSWEDSPGVSKIVHQEYSPELNAGPDALNLAAPPSHPLTTTFPAHAPDGYGTVLANEVKIPLPPCPKPKVQPPHRSLSAKGLRYWWQEDPFLAAYKECTKRGSNGKYSSGDQDKKGFIGSKVKIKGKPFMFSCKNSNSDVRDDTFVRLSGLPPLPREHRARDG